MVQKNKVDTLELIFILVFVLIAGYVRITQNGTKEVNWVLFVFLLIIVFIVIFIYRLMKIKNFNKKKL